MLELKRGRFVTVKRTREEERKIVNLDGIYCRKKPRDPRDPSLITKELHTAGAAGARCG